MTDPVRIGVLGAGLIAAYHVVQFNVADVPNRIVAVHDPDADRARALADGQGAVVAAGPEEVVAAADAVLVATWTAAHLPLARTVAAAGLPMFVEKPLSTDLASARELVAAVAGVPTMVGLVLRTSPALLALREWIRDPASGRVMAVSFRDDQYLPTQGMYASTWRGDRRLAGSGVLLEHSIHDLDVLEWLVGPLDSVAARQSSFHDLDGIEDAVSVALGFRSGAVGTLTTVWHDVLSRPSQRRIEVFCERATLTLEGDWDGPVRRQTSEGEEVLEGSALRDRLVGAGIDLRSAEERFLDAVVVHRAGRDPGPLDPDVTTALRAHVLADLAYRSAAGGGSALPVPAPGRGDPAPGGV